MVNTHLLIGKIKKKDIIGADNCLADSKGFVPG